MSDFHFVTYKESDFRHHYAMEREYASAPKPKRSRPVRNPFREEDQRLFLCWDREVTRCEKAGEPTDEAVKFREHYREEMLFWSRSQ